MNSADVLQRFIFEDLPIRGEIVHLNETFDEIVSQHQYPPMIRQLLGEMLVVAALLTATVKFKGRLTVQFQGKNKLKLLLAQCDHQFHLRGLAQWDPDLEPNEILTALQQGVLAIIMEPLAEGAKSYQGIVTWQGSSIAESIEGYFQRSEQIRTRIWLAVNQQTAAGLLLQVMPKESGIDAFSNKTNDMLSQTDQHWDHVIHLTETITTTELLMLPHETLLYKLYAHENEVRVFAPAAVAFRCSCSVERSENAIRMLGRKEIDEELQNKQTIDVVCHFCNKKFIFDRVDIERIFKQKGGSGSSTQMH